MARAKRKPWLGGYIHPSTGRYYIEQEKQGRRYHFSTGCLTAEAALDVFVRFEKDPEGLAAGLRAQPERCSYGDLCKEFLAYSLHVKGNSAKHVVGQSTSLDNLAKYLEARGLVFDPRNLTPSLVDDYSGWRRQGGVTGRVVGAHSVALDVAAFKVFASWLADRKRIIERDPLSEYAIPRRPKSSSRIRVFTMDEWAKVREALGSMRWRLAGDVLLGSWMRYSSLSRLTAEDVDLENSLIRLPGNEIKGKEGVTLKVSERVAKAAKALTMAHLPSSASMFDKRLTVACARAGVTRWTVHAFRHSAARMGLEDGLSLQDIQHRLAHSSLQVTELYLRALTGSRGEYRGRL